MAALHYLNLGHENAILTQSPYYHAPENVRRMMADLSFLPAWYGDAADKVLVDKALDTEFMHTITPFNSFLAQPIVCNSDELSKSNLAELNAAPWGLSPQSIHFFNTLKQKHNYPLIVPTWRTDYYLLCSRKTAAICLEGALNQLNRAIDHEIIPTFCTTIDEVEQYTAINPSPYLLKAPFSSSGRGLVWVYNKEIAVDKKQYISGILKKQGYISIEPVLNKQVDFAMEFYADGKGNVNYVGLSLFNTATQGGYTGNFVGEQTDITEKLSNWVDINVLNQVKEAIEAQLKLNYATTYQGYLGVDMMIYQIGEGRYKIHPCVEINMRYTMGLVALRLSEKVVQAGCTGQFNISYYRDKSEALTMHHAMQKQHPTQIKAGKLCSGYLNLCPIDKDTSYCATLLISNV